MKRGFLKTNRRPLYEYLPASAQAAQESLNGGPPIPIPIKVLDITELVKGPKLKEESKLENAADRTIGIIAGVGQSVPAPNFEDKTKSFLTPGLIHRIPSLSVTQGKEPSTICLLWSSSLAKIPNTPGYPRALPKTCLPNKITIKSAPKMGLGLFAKHDLKVSELFLVERALLIVPLTIPIIADSAEQLSLSEAKLRQASNVRYEKMLEEFLGLMTKKDADAFRKLENCHSEDGYKLFGIVLTNGYPMDFDEGDEMLRYQAIGNKGSRINHSCTPNVFIKFDVASFSLRYTATRDIKAGEQLFYAYCDPMQPAKKRQEALDRYKFVCRCTACENATPESDELRERYGIDAKKMSSGWKEVLLCSEFKGDSLESLLNMEKEMMKEGLNFSMAFPLLLNAIAKVYIKLDDQKKASEYKEKLGRYDPTFLKVIGKDARV